MTDLNMGAQPAINFSALDAELRAALPDKLNGSSYTKGTLLVHVKDGEDAEALRPAIASALAAHDPAVLTPEQQEAAASASAALELKAADFDTWLAGVNSATTIADMKVRLRQLGRVVWLVAKAQGMTDAADPGV